MKTFIQGKNFGRVDVTYLSPHGLWLLANDSEIFVSFIDFPQLRTASPSKLKHVVRLRSDILYWPDLHIEIPVKHVRCFPLLSVKPYPTIRSNRQGKTRPIAV
jgi:hypothetical protein